MKILYIFNFEYPEYQSDSIYHGLIDSGMDVYESHYPSYMLSSYENLNSIYGRGFTIFGKLNHTPKVEPERVIREKIKLKFYDYIFYGCVYTHVYFPKRQCLDYLDDVIQNYPKDRIHFIDGYDEPFNTCKSMGLDSYGTVWKTHLIDYNAGNPISFAIPESQLIQYKIQKEKKFATIIPGEVSTYIYDNEIDYYHDYAISYYAMTWKKSQWDCMRHYEILANKTIPYFPDIDDCPPLTLSWFPKDIITETNKYARRYEIHPNYDEICEYLFDYTKNNLTTKQLIKKFF